MASDPKPERPSAQRVNDGITNVVTGIGTNRDPRSYNSYYFHRMTDQQIDAAYRASWVMRKIIDKPATEMVREWRDWQAEADQIKLIEALERKLDLRNKIKKAEILRGLGGAAMVMWVGNEDPALPINPRTLTTGSLRGVHVWHKSRLTLEDMETDPASDWYGFPKFYRLNTRDGRVVRLHPSRVIAFRGLDVSDLSNAAWTDAFWGDSRVQSVLEAVENMDTAQNGFAALIKDARNRRIGIPGLTNMLATAEGERIMTARMNAVASLESMLGVTFYDSGEDGKNGETIEDRQMTWAGIPDINNNYAAFTAAAGDMPATVFLGKSPDGQNSTGQSDQDIWEKTIKAKQDLDLRPCLDQLDIVLIPSALGAANAEVWWQFAPLSTMNEKDEATTFNTFMQGVTALVATGMIPEIAMEKALQTVLSERGWLPGLDGALAELPEDERFPSLDEPDPADPSLVDPTDVVPPRRAANDGRKRWRAIDAEPRTLYVRRDVQNVGEIAAWAKAQGIPDLADDLHVTIAFSYEPVDWIKMGAEWTSDAKGQLTIAPGGPRVVEPLGEMSAVLMFASSDLTWRNMSMREAGASWDYADYQPHISLTKSEVDLSKIEPYRGKIVLGPEIFEEVRTGDAA